MGQSDEDVVRAYIDATEDLDLERMGELIADDIVGHVPGNNPISGDYQGREEVMAYYNRLFERSKAAGGGIEVDMHDLLVSDDHVVVLSSRTFAAVEARAVVIYHVEDGKIEEVWVHEADQAHVDEVLNRTLSD